MSSIECQRIGHGGASALAPANTLASFDAALEVGIDVVEFDVRTGAASSCSRTRSSTSAARRQRAAARRARTTSAPAGSATSGSTSTSSASAASRRCSMRLRARGLLERTLISCQVPAVRRPRPQRSSRGPGPGSRSGAGWRGQPTLARLARPGPRGPPRPPVGRADGPARARRPPLLEDVVDRGGHLYAWTVNDRAAIAGLRVARRPRDHERRSAAVLGTWFDLARGGMHEDRRVALLDSPCGFAVRSDIRSAVGC